MADAQQDGRGGSGGGSGGGNSGGGDDAAEARKRRIVLLCIAVLGVGGYACLAVGGCRGGGGRPAGGSSFRLAAVDLRDLSTADAPLRPAGDGVLALDLPAGATVHLAVAERSSWMGPVRSLGLHLPAGRGDTKVTVIYTVTGTPDGAMATDLRPKLEGDDHRVDLPRKPADGEDPIGDLRTASMSLLTCAGRLTVRNGDEPSVLELR